MDNLDIKAPVQPPGNDLQAQFDALQHLVVSILLLVFITSAVLTFFLWRQWVWVKRDLAGAAPARQMVAEFQKANAPAMNSFVSKITEYGRTHPDFAPIMAKYGLKPAIPTN